MRKHYVSKSAIFLAMLVATGSAQFVKAETPTTTTSPATSLTEPLQVRLQQRTRRQL